MSHLKQLSVRNVTVFPVVQEDEIERRDAQLFLHFGDPITGGALHQGDLKNITRL